MYDNKYNILNRLHCELYFPSEFSSIWPGNCHIMFSALVSQQPGEKVVNYPVRPVDTTTDFEGTASLQPSQPVRLCCFKFLDHYANLKSYKYSTSMLPLMGLSFSY